MLPLILFVARYGVDVPYGDQWQLVPVFAHVAQGHPSADEFFRQYNEHRLTAVLPVVAALALASGWDVRWELWLDVALGLLTAVGLQRLVRREGPTLEAVVGTLAACAVAYGLQQSENWLMGIQVTWLMVQAPVVWAVVALSQPERPWPGRVSLAAALCAVASFSQIQGLLAFPSLLPLLLAEPAPTRRHALAAWGAAFALVAGVYAIGFRLGGAAAASLSHPDAVAVHALTVLGAPLVRGVASNPQTAAPVAGAALLFAFLTVVSSATARAGRAGWVGLGSFAVLFAAAVGCGRAFLGAGQAFAPRYAAHATLLPLALLLLLRPRNARTLPRLTWLLMAALLLALLGFTTRAALPGSAAFHERLLRGRACLEIVDRLEAGSDDTPASCLGLLAPEDAGITQHELRGLLPTLAALGFGPRPQALVPLDVAATAGAVESPEGSTSMGAEGAVPVSGWAVVPQRSSPAELALVIAEPAGGSPASNQRRIVAAAIVEGASSRWSVVVPARLLGEGRWRISALAYGSPGLAAPLGGAAVVEVRPPGKKGPSQSQLGGVS